MNIDLELLKLLNGVVADSRLWTHIMQALANNELVLGVPVFTCLAIVALSPTSSLNKSKILLGILATCLSLGISVYFQTNINIHLRPIFDNTIDIVNVLGKDNTDVGGRLYSLPSDTATAYVAISTIIFLQNRKLGIGCFLWNLLTVGVARVAIGMHYPSDIVTGFMLAFVMVYALSSIKFAQNIIQELMKKYDTKSYFFNAIVLLFSAEAYGLFPGLQEVYEFAKRLLKG
jgi:membrane-associated phospholipid phosphatase